MRKFGFFAAIAVILAGFGGWLASTSQARLVGPIATGPRVTKESSTISMGMVTGPNSATACQFCTEAPEVLTASALSM